MPIYGIIKKYLGEWLDIFVLFFVFLFYYLGILNWAILYSCMEVLGFLYLYKIYHIIFARQYDVKKEYVFKWDFYRILSWKIVKNNKKILFWLFYIIITIMPWNLFWYLLVNFAAWKKLVKVWFNGNKDIFFLKYFGYDIRPLFERYIIWYYKYIDRYIVNIFIHEPLLRLIVIPTIIRTSIIECSFLAILKARIFMFVFFSILIITGVNEYLHQPWYVWVMFEYVYLLIIWPIIAKKIFNMEYVKIGERVFTYVTPINIFSAFHIAYIKSVSLIYLSNFLVYLQDTNDENWPFFVHRFNMFSAWYTMFFWINSLTSYGNTTYMSEDRLLSAIMFWRYEKTYTSFVCFYLSTRADKYYFASIFLVLLKDYKLYGSYINEKEVENMIRFLEYYYRIYIFFICESTQFVNSNSSGICLEDYLFDNKAKETPEGYEYVIMEFYKKKELLISKEEIKLEFSSTRRYREMLILTEFFWNYYWPSYMLKYINWFNLQNHAVQEILRSFKLSGQEDIVVTRKDLYIYIFHEVNNAILNKDLIDSKRFNALLMEFNKLCEEKIKENGMEGIVKKEYIEELKRFRFM